jgi:hypothetical protein
MAPAMAAALPAGDDPARVIENLARAPMADEEETVAGDTANVDPVPPPESDPDIPPRDAKDHPSAADKPSANLDPPQQAAAVTLPSSKSGGGASLTPIPSMNITPKAIPDEYRLRTGDHTEVAKGHGASPASEAAVVAALRWLSTSQAVDGRWEPRRLGGGARAIDGQDRGGAGTNADTGITGLALLAFLAGGHTHLQGSHQSTVRGGLEFLLSAQAADGNLGASQNMYERMYCHAMATCALSEAYAMSGDDRLGAPLRRALNFTLDAQDRSGGGWRYRRQDPGDTSLLGWQVMSLKSAHLAGLATPDPTRAGIERFLRKVAGGRERGLACYQPTRPVPSRSMTAEALVCRRFMGMPDSPAALDEASGFILQELPGAATTNLYYWYYGTLAMYQLQGEPWRLWNEALQSTLLGSQRQDGTSAGSWDPDPVWGGCGGRVYSTALSALCLEVYYRFLPLYVEAAGRERRTQ